MAAKDRYQATFTCPTCRAKATGEVEENDYPFMNRLDRRVCIAAPFVTRSTPIGDDEVWCGKCNQKAN